MSALPASIAALQSVRADDARLPATYESAVLALSECSRIDECQQWADRAEALASYARQSKDDRLRAMADRIQARAIRRCGELLRAIPAATGAHLKQDGAVPLSRTSAADEAGLSERQRKTALRVAAVPVERFEAQVESAEPPTITALAKQGTVPRSAPPATLVKLDGIDPADFARATEAQGALQRFADYCSRNDPERIARAFKAGEVVQMRGFVSTVDAWLDRFVVNLRG
jgi:hypothetical protein